MAKLLPDERTALLRHREPDPHIVAIIADKLQIPYASPYKIAAIWIMMIDELTKARE